MIIDRKKKNFWKKFIFGVWGAFYVILPISGVRFDEKISDQHSVVHLANVKDPSDLEY